MSRKIHVTDVSSFRQIYLPPGCLVLLDIDDTLIDRNENLIGNYGPGFVRAAHRRGCTVIGITARSIKHSAVTIKRMKELGIHYSPTPRMNFVKSGCAFTNGQLKGPFVKELIERYQKDFDVIIFVDDVLDNLISVGKSLKDYDDIHLKLYRMKSSSGFL